MVKYSLTDFVYVIISQDITWLL